jgi:PAS domain-containing protein
MTSKSLLKKKFEKEEVDFEDNWVDILNNLHDIVIYQDLDKKILWANEMAIEEFGSSFEEMIDQPCY